MKPGILAVLSCGLFFQGLSAAPVIVTSNIYTQLAGQTTATVVWITQGPADTQVNYGLTSAYGSSTTLAPALVISHSVKLTGLMADTLYHYQVLSRDQSGALTASGDFTFTTLSSPATPYYTWACPQTVYVNHAVTCTVTLSAGTYYDNSTRLDLSYSPGMSLCHVLLSCTTGDKNFTGSYGVNIASFQFLATTAGTKTISSTNTGAWLNPPPLRVNVVKGTPPDPHAGVPLMPAFVNGVCNNSHGIATALTTSVSPGMGHTIFAGLGLDGNYLSTPPAVTTNLGSSFVLDGYWINSYGGNTQGVYLYHHLAEAGITSVKVARTDGIADEGITFCELEFTNIAPINVVDTVSYPEDWPGPFPPGTTWFSDPFTTTNSYDVLIGLGWVVHPGAPAFVAPWTQGAFTADTTDELTTLMGYQIVKSAGTYQVFGVGRIMIGYAAAYIAQSAP